MMYPDDKAWTGLHQALTNAGYAGSLSELDDLWNRAVFDSSVRFLLPMVTHLCGNPAIKTYIERLVAACEKRGLLGVIHGNHFHRLDELTFTLCGGRRAPTSGPRRVSSVTIEIIKTGNHEVTVEVEAYRNSESCKRITRKFQRSGKK